MGPFGWIAVILILTLGAIMGGMGAGREFRELILSFLLLLFGFMVVVVLGVAISVWNAWAGLAFLVVAGLYILDRMIHHTWMFDRSSSRRPPVS